MIHSIVDRTDMFLYKRWKVWFILYFFFLTNKIPFICSCDLLIYYQDDDIYVFKTKTDQIEDIYCLDQCYYITTHVV